jgi:hypothetical protein
LAAADAGVAEAVAAAIAVLVAAGGAACVAVVVVAAVAFVVLGFAALALGAGGALAIVELDAELESSGSCVDDFDRPTKMPTTAPRATTNIKALTSMRMCPPARFSAVFVGSGVLAVSSVAEPGKAWWLTRVAGNEAWLARPEIGCPGSARVALVLLKIGANMSEFGPAATFTESPL